MSRRVRRRVASCVAASFVLALGTPVRPVPVAAAAAVPVGVPRHEESPALARTVRNLRSKIKYVFVLYQENRSFDFYFGSYPGAMGLFSQPPKDTPGYHQPIENTDGSMTTLSPFRIDPSIYSADTDDADHSHTGLLNAIDARHGTPRMDGYAMDEEAKYSPSGPPSLQAKQYAELTMAHVDCDTIPILWNYANKFVLFDQMYQELAGPSTPGNIAIFSAQSGVTQLVEHPSEVIPGNGDSGPGVPVLNDSNPFWGSAQDTTTKHRMPYNPGDGGTPEDNLTFASLPLTLAGKNVQSIASHDRAPQTDLADVQDDIARIAGTGITDPADWGWFEEGFDREPTDGPSGPKGGTHNSYITHHNGPQYFGYLSNNLEEQSHFHGMADFFDSVKHQRLAPDGGVYYLKGGFQNIWGLTPTDPDPAVQQNFVGDDDHPGYSDAQISEANVAQAVNAIANSPYWQNSAIVVTWDDSEGYYDHMPPPLRATLPGVGRVGDGPRVPLIVISPFAKTGTISHDMGDQASVVKLVDNVFGVEPLASLPDEARARKEGLQEFGQSSLGPYDGDESDITTLLSAFDEKRLAGLRPPLPASYATIPQNLILNLPAATGYGCKTLGVVPTDIQLGLNDVPPADFNPRPGTDPPSNAPRRKVSTQSIDD